MLTDAKIDSAIYAQCPDFDEWHEGPSIDDFRSVARAIESAATEPLLARIEGLERQLEEARKDAADADSMCEAMKKVIDQNDARWKFLHTTNKDAEGYEWCVLRVKWENGRISEALHTYSNMADLDAAIKDQT